MIIPAPADEEECSYNQQRADIVMEILYMDPQCFLVPYTKGKKGFQSDF